MLIKTYRLRLYAFYIVPFLVMVGLVVRLYYLQVAEKAFWKELADQQHYSTIHMIPMRGKILDSNGHELAGSVILDAGYIELARLPKGFNNQEVLSKMAHELSDALHLNYDKVYNQLSGKYNRSPLLARDLNDRDKVEIKKILHTYQENGIPSTLVRFQQENKRQYSDPEFAPHVVGFTQRDMVDMTGDNKGASGVERFYDKELKGQKESFRTKTTATGNPMEPANPEILESTYGHSIVLTLNESLQRVTQDVLAQGVDKARADSGVAVCYAVKTGEILSFANYPTFRLDNLEHTTASETQNRAISAPIEPGSVMKIVTFTSLFNDKLIGPEDYINCEGGEWIIPGINRRVTDSHDLGSVPVSEIFQYSSNIGTIKAAQRFDRKSFYDHIKRFGFGERTGIDMPGESKGILRDVKDWDNWSMSSLPMGYEMQVTAAQVVAAVGAVANKGVRLRPHIVKEILDHSGNVIKRNEPEVMGTVASPSACRKTLQLMELVVEKGTAKPAKLEGYRVGGKTGTTKKISDNGIYENRYIAGFCGIAPLEDPEVCIYVYIDNPRGENIYGGSVAGPVFREICREAMRVLHIPSHRQQMPADDFKQTLTKVREEIKDRAPREILSGLVERNEEEVTSGTMPRLLDMSMAEAVRTAAKMGIEVKVSGSGIVVDQDPAPYETLEDKPVVTLTLANQRQYVRQHVEDYEYLMNLKSEEADTSEPVETVSSSSDLSSLTLTLSGAGEAVEVPVNVDHRPITGSAPQQSGKVQQPYTEQYPDLDEFANKAVDSQTAKKSWDRFMKDYEKLKKEREEAPKPQSEAEVLMTNTETKPTDRPIPELDGSEEIDPDAGNNPAPLDIKTPARRPEKKVEPAREQLSLYNL